MLFNIIFKINQNVTEPSFENNNKPPPPPKKKKKKKKTTKKKETTKNNKKQTNKQTKKTNKKKPLLPVRIREKAKIHGIILDKNNSAQENGGEGNSHEHFTG